MIKTDDETMRLNGEYFTVQDMAKILGESTNTIKKRILRLGIKALVKNALYTSDDLENIKSVTIGRPKKADAPKKPKPPKSKGKK
jgi:predicted ArsR family transcriptional regulator